MPRASERSAGPSPFPPRSFKSRRPGPSPCTCQGPRGPCQAPVRHPPGPGPRAHSPRGCAGREKVRAPAWVPGAVLDARRREPGREQGSRTGPCPPPRSAARVLSWDVRTPLPRARLVLPHQRPAPRVPAPLPEQRERPPTATVPARAAAPSRGAMAAAAGREQASGAQARPPGPQPRLPQGPLEAALAIATVPVRAAGHLASAPKQSSSFPGAPRPGGGGRTSPGDQVET